MVRPFFRTVNLVCVALIMNAAAAQTGATSTTSEGPSGEATLLTDPFLQLPTEDAVRVVWFTEFEGTAHRVHYGADLAQQVQAQTVKLSRMAEDSSSRVGEQTEDGEVYSAYTPRDVWRHEAVVSGLTQGERVPYAVTSVTNEGAEVSSETYTLAPLPAEGQALKILLTSDHQLMPMTPANLQKVEETVGRLDAVFLAGDLVNIPDRASEWFDDNRTEGRGGAFFQNLQGRSSFNLEHEGGVTTYRGGEIIQHAPLFPVVGNHEVMGRFNTGSGLNDQYNDPRPLEVAEGVYERLAELYNPNGDEAVRAAWLADNSFNTISYEELFTLPSGSPGGETYYSVQFGDVYLIGLYATRIWRSPSLSDDTRGKYREAEAHLNTPDNWGWGEFIFEDLSEGSAQHTWLLQELESEAFQKARYKIVMMHQPVHGLGDNSNPVFAHPVQILDRAENGALTGVRYEYPLGQDIFIRDVEPHLQAAGVQLVHSGHSHVWHRFVDDAGMNHMETSNVGNTYGCYVAGYAERSNGPDDPRFNAENYVLTGDPHGLEPVLPSIMAPQTDEAGDSLPCVSSNELSAFSILDTGTGTVKSYVFDTREPDAEAVLFDEFPLARNAP